MKIKKKLFWATNFVVLGLFSFYSLSGLFGLGSHQAYAATLNDKEFHKKSKNFVVVDDDKRENGGEISTDQEICALTPVQAAQLDAFFNVKLLDIDVEGGTSVQLAAIKDKRLTKRELLDFLRASDQTLECQVVRVHSIFFLPVLPQIS